MYFPYLQGRVPAWNLAGLLPPDPTSPGPGGPSPGVSSATPGGLPHPLPHYSGAYGAQPHSHYPHILQPQGSEVPHHPWPPNMEAAGSSEPASAATAASMHYKMDPDASAVMSMYYSPHQGALATSTSAESPAASSATTPVTTSAPSTVETLQIPNFSISTSTASEAGQDILHPYLGHPSGDMPATAIPEGN